MSSEPERLRIRATLIELLSLAEDEEDVGDEMFIDDEDDEPKKPLQTAKTAE